MLQILQNNLSHVSEVYTHLHFLQHFFPVITWTMSDDRVFIRRAKKCSESTSSWVAISLVMLILNMIVVSSANRDTPLSDAGLRMSVSPRQISPGGIFKGGTLSVRAINSSAITVTQLIAWDLDNGPCGPICEPGLSTQAWRTQVIKKFGDSAAFGRWFLETRDQTHSKNKTDITDLVKRDSHRQVLQVSTHHHWVLELTRVDIPLSVNLRYVDVIMEGSPWTPVQKNIQPCRPTQQSCSYHLQIKFFPGIRNDTGMPNHTPMATVRPIYKVVMDQENRIPLVILDIDGDPFFCRAAAFVELGGIAPLRGVNVGTDCTVSVMPTSSLGFKVGDIGAVNFIVHDTTMEPLEIGNSRTVPVFDNMSATQVEFLVQVVTTSKSPEFIYPSRCSAEGVKQISVISGATLRLPLYARPSNSSPDDAKIEKFAFRVEPDEGSAPTLTLPRPGDGSVSWSDLEWKFNITEDTIYSLEVVAVDNTGEESVCVYKILAKRQDYLWNSLPNVSAGPALLLPDRIRCEQFSMCVFPVYAKGDDGRVAIFDTPLGDTDKQSVRITSKSVGTIIHNGDRVLQSDITIECNRSGHVDLCFAAVDWHGNMASKCTYIDVPEPESAHPCLANGTMCGRFGRCNPHPERNSDFQCVCAPSYTGSFCETLLNPCDYGYCGENAVQCLFSPAITLTPLCVCNENFTGDVCHVSVYCDPDPCSSHGNCTADERSASYMCVCDEGYTGGDCSQHINPLTLDIIATEVNCSMSTRIDWLHMPDRDAVAMVSLSLTLRDLAGDDKVVWSINAFGPTVTVSGKNQTLAQSAKVEASISSQGPASLHVVWPQASLAQAGIYECKIGVIDSVGQPYQFSHVAALPTYVITSAFTSNTK